ncbi:UNVERIFIED_CONTAM: hypothetical protein FKN15_056580 [Acipenser sinensis]
MALCLFLHFTAEIKRNFQCILKFCDTPNHRPPVTIQQVPFQDVLDLVRGRKVYLNEELAFIPHQEIVAIVLLNDFRTRLSKELASGSGLGRGGNVQTAGFASENGQTEPY